MSGYLEWNDAIARFFTDTAAIGSSVFLTFNDRAAEYIGSRYLDLDPAAAVVDFVQAVKATCTSFRDGERRVALASVVGERPSEHPPRGLAFLSAMVLAAHRMSDEGSIDPGNYFERFRELLELSPGNQSRPLGFGTGDEEPLWLGWNAWLEANGWNPTAHRGPEGPSKYLQYTISQALLRDDDKRYLSELFRTRQLRGMDEGWLGAWLIAQRFTRQHLRDGFGSPDAKRRSAFVDAAYELYLEGTWTEDGQSGDQWRRQVTCGLRRSVSMSGAVSYLLLPREPQRWKPTGLWVAGPEGRTPLRRMRPGFFEALWPIKPFTSSCCSWAVDGDPAVESLVFPTRDFWILTRDPEDPRGGLATWERAPSLLGKPFIIIVRADGNGPKLESALENYRTERLIQWGEIVVRDGVTEYRGCMVLSRAWEAVLPSDETRELYESLRPREFATVALLGGLRAPGQHAWLANHPPSLKVYGFEKRFKLNVTNLDTNQVVLQRHIDEQEVVELSQCEGSAHYLADILWEGDQVSRRTFQLIDWNDLRVAQSLEFPWTPILGSKGKRAAGPLVDDDPLGTTR